MSSDVQEIGPDLGWEDPRAGEIHLDPVEKAVEALRSGLPVLVVDDADRENEGDVIMAAVHASPEWVGWTIRHTSGVLCAPMPDEQADALRLPHMVERNEESLRTAYTVSVDARSGIATGISAADRSITLRLLADEQTVPEDLVRPGHVFPLRARPGGVLERRGHTEAAVDLCVLAGLPPVGVLAEVVEDAGPVTRLPGLRALADEFGLPLISIEDLVAYRREHPSAEPETPVQAPARVRRVAESLLPTSHGDFRAIAYRDMLTGHEHVALVAGDPSVSGALVRVHSECLTGDAFGSSRCDCGPQLAAAMDTIAAEGGVVVYLRGHEGRGIGLLAKLTAYQLQDSGLDTVAANTAQGLPADAREYGAAAAVLDDLGLDSIRLLTNNPAKLTGLAEHGITVTERIGLQVGVNRHNQAYLTSKRDLMGHQLDAL
ncbi:bifunctional 3,4-dihydroxy-2-butanone-4-phosphate synthase/GTP cyclohydrolase II [Kineosporia babensis]|uniref:Multifunctional fusion protein n=1 Tax=Kineosporia babensis TaxID=499548 RepID=A0A9X1ST41_9ACTN|nr:bifunctional 3,4-dihydroxy-2-butanone-4-phosphate synthase/GTP cyclohydrolase II [Kineosporia babensis]MCD5311424.1 bifunctional 3,4-dihydroxy-2-butanone-4-phosphate synthase/GTP cyclohydrolase II [Kineosporia babensis]